MIVQSCHESQESKIYTELKHILFFKPPSSYRSWSGSSTWSQLDRSRSPLEVLSTLIVDPTRYSLPACISDLAAALSQGHLCTVCTLVPVWCCHDQCLSVVPETSLLQLLRSFLHVNNFSIRRWTFLSRAGTYPSTIFCFLLLTWFVLPETSTQQVIICSCL